MASPKILSEYKEFVRILDSNNIKAGLEDEVPEITQPYRLSEELGKTKELTQNLDQLEMIYLPESSVQQINSTLVSLLGRLGVLNTFEIDRTNKEANISALSDKAAELRASISEFTKAALPSIAYLFYRTNRVKELSTSLREAYDSARRYFLDTHEYATKKKVEIDAIVTELQSLIATQRDLVGAEAVGKFSNAFQEAATSHGSAAKKWLVGALVSAALTAGVAVMLVFLLPIKNDGAGQIAQHVLTRVIVLGLFLTAVFWCGRFYRSNKHLEVVNNHRFNGMRTFLAFTQATKDPATKNAVLLETTRAIYSNVATGYLAKTDGSPESDLRIIELVKSLAQGGGSSTGS